MLIKNNVLLFIAFLLVVPLTHSWAADAAQLEVSQVWLVADETAIAPGKSFKIGLLLEPKPGWHTYWQNPGDAGMPTTVNLTLPNGFSASAVDWPVPERLKEGPLVTYAYTKTTLLPVTVTPPATLAGDSPIIIHAKADWLVCRDICIPQSATLELSLPVAQAGQPPAPGEKAVLFAANERDKPEILAEPVWYTADAQQFSLSLPLHALGLATVNSAIFFPRQENVIQYAAKQTITVEGGRMILSTASSGQPPAPPLSGLLLVKSAGVKAFDITLSPSPVPFSAVNQDAWLPTLLVFALLGGLVLNLMPCVLPVLSLKALAIARKSGQERSHTLRQGLAYTCGILLTFALISLALAALRQTGEVVGWGFQMQSPAFVGFLVYVLFLVGLNLSGFFQLPVLLGNANHALDDSSLRGSFFTGVLATLVATPCTAPFMATAVGAALTLPAWKASLIFESLGLGLALPFLLLSSFPGLLRLLPRPGAWMETFKQCLAFPLYGSVIWLLWVLTLQTGDGGMVLALSALLLMVFFIWLNNLTVRKGKPPYMYWLCLAAVFTLSLIRLSHLELSASTRVSEEMGNVETVDFNKTRLAELQASGKPVFVDATAAWCITCQLNGRTTLHSAAVTQAFKEMNVTLMVADWTRQNADITEFLSGFGYKGVPLYVFYPANHGAPAVLPQLLTADTVIATLHHP